MPHAGGPAGGAFAGGHRVHDHRVDGQEEVYVVLRDGVTLRSGGRDYPLETGARTRPLRRSNPAKTRSSCFFVTQLTTSRSSAADLATSSDARSTR
jgi:hypothetical protein